MLMSANTSIDPVLDLVLVVSSAVLLTSLPFETVNNKLYGSPPQYAPVLCKLTFVL